MPSPPETTKRADPPADEDGRNLDRFKDYPDLSFWYHFSPDEIHVLPHWLRRVYVDALPRLKAEVTADRINAVSFPNLKPNERKSMSNRLNRILNPKVEKPKSRRELRDSAAVAGIGMKVVKKRKGAEK